MLNQIQYFLYYVVKFCIWIVLPSYFSYIPFNKLFVMKGTNLETGIDLDVVSKYSAYWEQTRNLYGPFECTKTMR